MFNKNTLDALGHIVDRQRVTSTRTGHLKGYRTVVIHIDKLNVSTVRLKAIAFPRIAGGKPFDISAPWFLEMMAEIGQTVEPAGE